MARLRVRGVALRLGRAPLLLLLSSACPGPKPAAHPSGPAVSSRGDGTLDLAWAGLASLAGAEPRVHAAGGWSGCRDYPMHAFSADGGSFALSCTGLTGAPDLALEGTALGAGLALTVTAQGSVPVDGFELLSVRADAGSQLSIGAGGALTFLQQGMQSWSFSGALAVSPATPLPLTAQGGIAWAAADGDPLRELPGVSAWVGAAWPAGASGPALLAGALTAARFKTSVALGYASGSSAAPDLRITSGATGDPAVAGVTSETVLIEAAPALAAVLADYGARLPVAASGRRPEPDGWFSWDQAFAAVDGGYLGAEATAAQQSLLPLGLSLFEVDDGWEVAWGDWSPGPSLGADLAGEAQALRARGLLPGLWMAPFLVRSDSALAQQQPRWFVEAPDGGPLVTSPAADGHDYLVLDPTAAGVEDYLAGLTAGPVAAGFGLLKLDFLYTGAVTGARSDPTASALQGLARGLAALRRGAGTAHLNACGAPLLPVLGVFDSLRSGNDIVIVGTPPAEAFIAFEARELGARSFLDAAIALDPDEAVVRPPLSEDEARSAATLAALSGNLSLGDDLIALPAPRLAVALQADLVNLGESGHVAQPLDLATRVDPALSPSPLVDWLQAPQSATAHPPERWLGRGRDGTSYLALFNFSDQAQTVALDPGQATGAAVSSAVDVWSGTRWPAQASLSLAAHGVTLLKLTP